MTPHKLRATTAGRPATLAPNWSNKAVSRAQLEVDDTRFVQAFGWGATPVDDAVRNITRWARGRYVRQAA